MVKGKGYFFRKNVDNCSHSHTKVDIMDYFFFSHCDLNLFRTKNFAKSKRNEYKLKENVC